MKILVVTNQFPSYRFPYKGTFVYQQTKEIQRQGHEIIVIAPNYGKEKYTHLTDGMHINKFRTFTKTTKDPLLRELFRGRGGLLALIMFILLQVLEIGKAAIKFKVDIIHAHWILPSGFSSAIVSRILRKKLVITSHGSDISYCSQRRLLRVFLKAVLQDIDFFIGVSKYLTQTALNLGAIPERSRTIHIGISSSLKRYRLDSKKRWEEEKKMKIIFVGSLYPVKGIDSLLQSIKGLSLERRDFIFTIVGDGELIGEMRSYLRKNQLESYCRILGFLPHNKTLEQIQDSDIALQTSISEGLSFFIQESVFLGKAIVATKVGGTGEIVINNYNGFLVEPGNVHQIVNKIAHLLSSRTILRNMSKKSLKVAQQKLSLENNVKEIIKIYTTI